MKYNSRQTVESSHEGKSYVYSGMLEVDEEEFNLDADRFIVRDGEIAFMFSGSDMWGDFRIEGVAKKMTEGHYVASQLKLIYLNYDNEDDALIQFDVVTPTAAKVKCFVKGQWRQYGDTWNFSGNLGRYKSKK